MVFPSARSTVLAVFAFLTLASNSAVLFARQDDPPTFPDGRENPAVNRFGLDALTLALPEMPCRLAPPQNDGVRGVHNPQTWPDGRVPYEFDGNVNQANRNAMIAAMSQIHAVCGARFVARAGEPDFLHIQGSANENSSAVGRQGGGQVVRIANWNMQFVMCHELMHALSLYHEQSRSDRDTYIIVEYQYIDAADQYNFNVAGDGADVGPYDFDSVMHYGQCAFANCPCFFGCLTILVRNPWALQWQEYIGQRSHLSVGDRQTLQALYGTGPVVWVDFGYIGPENGQQATPFNTLAEALAAAPAWATIRFRSSGSSGERPTINQPVTLQVNNGPVTIGN